PLTTVVPYTTLFQSREQPISPSSSVFLASRSRAVPHDKVRVCSEVYTLVQAVGRRTGINKPVPNLKTVHTAGSSDTEPIRPEVGNTSRAVISKLPPNDVPVSV